MKKIAMVFPGYGSQFVGMAKDLYDESRLVQEHFEQASNCLDNNFIKLCFASSDVELSKMHNTFPALFLVGASIFDVLKQEGIKPDIVAGYNTGHYAAMYASGSLSLPDGLYLTNKYALLYREYLDNNKLEVLNVSGIEAYQLEKLCKKYSTKVKKAHIALYKTKKAHVIIGSKEIVDTINREVMDLEGVTESIGAEIGLHSDELQEVANSFSMYCEKVDFKDSQIPLLSSHDVNEVVLSSLMKTSAIEHIVKPVLWMSVIEKLSSYDLFIEIGPGTYLRDMMKEQYPKINAISINKLEDIQELKKIIND